MQYDDSDWTEEEMETQAATMFDQLEDAEQIQ